MESPAPSIRAVLFDFDGTLVDSEYLHHEAWLEAVSPWGVTVGWEEYKRKLVGISDRRACEFFLGLAGMEATAEAMDFGRSRKHMFYRRRSVDELKLDPFVSDWIHANSECVPMGVVSSSAAPDVVPILERQGVADRMRFVVSGDDVSRLKPDPMSYLLALEKLGPECGIRNAAECLVFEDSETGIRASQDAGMTVQRIKLPCDLPTFLAEWDRRILRSAVRNAEGVPSTAMA